MKYTSGIKKSFRLKQILMVVLCLVFGLWGVYDLLVKLPREQQTYDQFEAAQQRLSELENLRSQRQQSGLTMSEEEILEYQQLEQTLQQLAPGGENPVAPSKFDAITQWIFILCLPIAPYYLLVLVKMNNKVYRLDEDGTLHLPAPISQESWTKQDIVDIDMSRWMKKSIAEVVHTSGKRVKLDDYEFDKLHLIVGSIAHRLYPDQWDEEARLVKSDKVKSGTNKATDLEEAESSES